MTEDQDILTMDEPQIGDDGGDKPKPKPKFNPNAKYEPVAETGKPKFDPNAHFVDADFIQPKVEFSQPNYKGKLNGNPDWVKDGAIVQPVNMTIPDKGQYHGDTGFDKELDENATKLNTKTNEAAQVIKNHLVNADNNYSDVVRQSRSDQVTPDVVQKEYHSKGQLIPIGALDNIVKQEKQKAYNQPVTQNDIEDAKTSINSNSNLTRQFLINSAKQDVGVNKSLYRLDAAQSLQGDPDAKYRLPQILKNDKDIESGDVDYDPNTGQLTKKEGFFGSIASSWNAKEKAFDKYSEYKSISNDDALISQLKSDIKDEQDKPQSQANGILGHIGAFIGGNPVGPMIAGGVTGAIPGAEETAPAVMAAVGSAEYYKMAYASGLKRSFAEYLQQDPNDEHEALRKAKIEAENEGNYAAATAAVMNLVGGKLGVETKFPTSATFKQSLVKGLKEVGEFAKTKLKEGAAVGTMGASGQILSNISAQDAGLNRDTLEGTGQQLAMGLGLPLAMGLLTKAPGILKKGTEGAILQQVAKAGDENVQPVLNEMQQSGHITPDEANAVQQKVADAQNLYKLIPDDISEASQQKIHDLLLERDNLKNVKMPALHETFHPKIKEEIKAIDEKILGLANDKAKPEEAISHETVPEGNTPEEIENQNNTQNAISEQTTGKSLLRNTGVRGEGELQGVGGQNQPESTTNEEGQGQGEGQKVGGPPFDLPFTGRTGEGIGISHGSAEARATDVPVLPPERGEGVTVEDAIKHGQDLLSKGGDADKAAADFKADKKISYDALSLVRAKHADLAKETNAAIDKFGEGSKQAQSAIKAESDWYKNTVKPMQTEWHKIGQAQQGESDIDTGSYMGMKRAFMQETGKEPSAQQAKEAKGLSDKVSGLTKQVEDLKQKLTDALNAATGGKVSFADEAKGLADAFRKLKSKPFKFKDSNGNEYDVQKMGLGWNDFVELGAKAIETTGKIADGIAAVLDKVKDLDWYHGLSENDKNEFAKQLQSHYEGDADLTTRFADKKDNKFDPQDAKDIWDYAKSNYLNKGKDFDTMIHGTAMDLGLTPKQIRNALTQPKGTNKITLDMYAKQAHQRMAIQQAKTWVKGSQTPGWKKVLMFVPNLFFRVKTFGHGTVGGITHGGMNIFRPSAWKEYWPNVIKQFEFSFGGLSKNGLANYEIAMQDLIHDKDFMTAKRAGLAVDPATKYDDYQTFAIGTGLGSRIMQMGDRGFNALKTMRLAMWKKDVEGLSDSEKADPEVLKSIATLVNHSTGTSHIPVPDVIGTAFFAPRLEASRWARLVTDPAKAIGTVLNWKNASAADKAAAKMVGKKSAEVLIAYGAALAANQGILMATGSKQSINFTDPTSSDWLKFKIGGRTVDASGGIITALGFATKMAHIAIESKSELKGKKRGDEFVSKGGGYLRGKLSPFGSTVADLATQHDFAGNTLPFSSDKPTTKFQHQLTWKEYVENQQTPIPVAEYFKDTEQQMKDKGMSEKDINTIMQGIFVSAMVGGTGVHITDDYKKNK